MSGHCVRRAVAIPGIVLVAGLAAAVVASVLHLPGATAGSTITLAEAAMLADHADVVRLLEHGADPNAPAHVRAGTLDLHEHIMSPLEAAVRSRQPGILQLLIDSGARMTEVEFLSLWCSAGRIPNNRDVIAFLDARRPRGAGVSDCSTVRLP